MTETFNEDFLDELFFCCISSKDFCAVISQHLKGNYIANEFYALIWQEININFKTYNHPPTIGKLKLEFRKNVNCLEIIDKIKSIGVIEQEIVLSNFEKFLKQVKFIEIYNILGDLYNQGKQKNAFNYFTKQAKEFEEFSLKDVNFTKLFKDFSKRQIERLTNEKKTRIPFGIDMLDNVTDGGGEKGEFTLFLGDAKAGKSQLLIHCGIAAARREFKVVHFQMEGTSKQCKDRYDSAWTGVLYKDMKTGNLEKNKIRKIKEVIQNMGKGEVYIKSYKKFGGATMVDMRNDLIDLKRLHGDIDVAIFDYLELAEPGDGKLYQPSEERFRQTKIARLMKDLAVELEVHVISATQSRVLSFQEINDPEFLLTAYNSSEDRGKIRPVDSFITINQTLDERKTGVCRLYCDRFRDHMSGQILPIVQNSARMRFYDRKKSMRTFYED